MDLRIKSCFHAFLHISSPFVRILLQSLLLLSILFPRWTTMIKKWSIKWYKIKLLPLSLSLSLGLSLSVLLSPLFSAPKYKEIKVNDLKWIRYLIILSSQRGQVTTPRAKWKSLLFQIPLLQQRSQSAPFRAERQYVPLNQFSGWEIKFAPWFFFLPLTALIWCRALKNNRTTDSTLEKWRLTRETCVVSSSSEPPHHYHSLNPQWLRCRHFDLAPHTHTHTH